MMMMVMAIGARCDTARNGVNSTTAFIYTSATFQVTYVLQNVSEQNGAHNIQEEVLQAGENSSVHVW